MSYFHDFDKELSSKWSLAVTNHISMILIGIVKEMAPSSHRSYFERNVAKIEHNDRSIVFSGIFGKPLKCSIGG